MLESRLWLQLAAAGLLFSAVAVANAAQPTDSLLPDSTKGYIAAADVETLVQRWNDTAVGKMLNDPIMRPFADDLRKQLTQKWSQSHARLGISLDDLRGIASGEACAAIVMPKGAAASLVILADVSGKEREAASRLNKVAASLSAQGAKATRQKLPGVEINVFDTVNKKSGKRNSSTIHYVKHGMFVATDSLAVARDVAARLDRPQGRSLAGVEAYQIAMKRCRAADRDARPDVHWYMEPIGLAEALRTWDANRQKGTTDYLKVAKNQGFSALKGVGGVIHLSSRGYGILHRTYAYAPPPYELAMRMAVFPNGGDFAPPNWIPHDISSYMTFQADALNAFDHFATVFDEIYGEEGVWKDTLESVEEDPNGPQINLRRDLVQHLGNRATIITDHELPITPGGQRRLLAIEAKNADKLALAIERSMSGDERARKLEIEGHDVWEMIPEDDAAANGGSGAIARRRRSRPEKSRSAAAKTANSAVTVANGHLIVASHTEFIRKVLTRLDQQEQLAYDQEYVAVARELPKLGSGDDCAQCFLRTQEQFRVTYELFKQGRLPEADTFLGHLVNFLVGEEKQGVTRKARLNGGTLPDYAKVQKYLGPSGLFVTSEKEGWYVVGFTPGGKAQLANEARAVRTK